ncbi:MAG: AI-2E family transporter, partial [Dehalococcoidia bacterium]|nr:AI-2E family transporter [Dehalococcoidia bacterium]
MLQEEPRLAYRQKVIIVSIIVLLFLIFLVLVRSILTPFIWAAIIAYLLIPIVNWVSRRTRLPRAAVLGSLYLVFGVALVWTSYFYIPLLVRELGDFRATIPSIIASLQKEILGAERIEFLGIILDPQNISASILRSLGAAPMGALLIVQNTATFVGQIIIFLVVT